MTEAQSKNHPIKDLIELTKPRLSFLVIITAAGGWWLAPSQVGWVEGAIAVTGTTITVGAANALNHYIERDSDKLMERTQSRPLPTGRMDPNVALLFGLILSAISIPMLTLLNNPLSGLLAGIALVSYVMVYTPLKRVSSYNTLVGALPGAMPPLIGWTAATYSIDPGGILLFALLFLWQIPHSLAITIYREREYKNAGIVVLPSVQGIESTRFQMLMYTCALLPIPPLLFLTRVSGWGTLVIGTGLGLWWAYKAWDGFAHNGGSKWARKFFLSSLFYLMGVFFVMTIDELIARFLVS